MRILKRNWLRFPINPLLGIKDYQIRDIAASIGLPAKYWKQFIKVVHGLWHAFYRMDATLVEIKPLVVTDDGRMLALDALMIVDDNASFRHPEFSDYWDLGLAPQPEVEATKTWAAICKVERQYWLYGQWGRIDDVASWI